MEVALSSSPRARSVGARDLAWFEETAMSVGDGATDCGRDVTPAGRAPMQRISVVGCSGSGKSTVAAALARYLDAPHIELDAIHHQPGWTALPASEFREQVGSLLDGNRWVVDGNYSAVRDLVWARADTVVWLDLPRPTIMAQLLPRTVARAVTRRELWNGNREPFTGMFRWDRERSILRWSWTSYPTVRARYETALNDPAHHHLRFVRLRSRADVKQWLDVQAAG